MTQYTVREINGGVVKVEYADGTELEIPVRQDMTEAEFDDIVYKNAPSLNAPSFLSIGSSRTASEADFEVSTNPDWMEKRLGEYGSAQEQIEYITENGLAAWQTRVAEIKARYPKIVD